MPRITFLRVYHKSFGLYHISIETLMGIAYQYQNLEGKQYPHWGNFQTPWVQLF